MKSKFITIQEYRDTLGTVTPYENIYMEGPAGEFRYIGWLDYPQNTDEHCVAVFTGAGRRFEAITSVYVEVEQYVAFVSVEEFMNSGGGLNPGRTIYQEDESIPSGMRAIGEYIPVNLFTPPSIDSIGVKLYGEQYQTAYTADSIFVRVKTQPIYE